MIAQIVFDLPLEGPFDYLVPEDLRVSVVLGSRVKVSFGPRIKIGFVIGLLEKSHLSKLKPIQSLSDVSPVFNSMDLGFARDFSAYYGCSLGEALGTVLRNREGQGPSLRRDHKPVLSLHRCRPDRYAAQIQEIMEDYRRQYKDTTGRYCQFLILVPDSYRIEAISRQLKGNDFKLGTRSSVFTSDGRCDCVIMVDDEDASYKQEQTPMYETRQVLLRRSEIFGFDTAFVGIAPSVELMALVREGRIKLTEEPQARLPPVRLIDLSNYKFIPGLISPPVRDAIEAALKARQRTILVLNRKGSYRLTRCVDCGEILKCNRCDSPLTFSRSAGQYLCRHCTYTAPGDTACPKCQHQSWRSQGIGVEQLQTELKKIFPQAKILSFERPAKINMKQSLPDADILIATQAVLRFQGQRQAAVAAFIDFDAELNRLEARSAFNAFSLALHVASMAESTFIQTRNGQHYVLASLAAGKTASFYDEEFKLRKEFGFIPFKHWVKLSWRGASEKSTHQAAQDVYNELVKRAPEHYVVTSPLVDTVGRKRGLFRFNVMLQVDDIPDTVAFIKSTLAAGKRPSRVITTMNVDP